MNKWLKTGSLKRQRCNSGNEVASNTAAEQTGKEAKKIENKTRGEDSQNESGIF